MLDTTTQTRPSLVWTEGTASGSPNDARFAPYLLTNFTQIVGSTYVQKQATSYADYQAAMAAGFAVMGTRRCQSYCFAQ